MADTQKTSNDYASDIDAARQNYLRARLSELETRANQLAHDMLPVLARMPAAQREAHLAAELRVFSYMAYNRSRDYKSAASRRAASL